MTKYARFVDRSDAQDGSDVRASDIVDMAAYETLPSWYTTDSEFLERIFSPQLVGQWKAAKQWFVPVPAGVQPGATYSGSDYMNPNAYRNPDGSDGDGNVRSGAP